MLGIKRSIFFDRAKPLLPIDRVRRGVLVDRNIPFAFRIIAAIIALAPNQRSDLAALDQLGCFVPTRGRAALGADLQDFAGFLYGILNFKGLSKIARQRSLDIDMLAGV